jgi:hypothetical protein
LTKTQRKRKRNKEPSEDDSELEAIPDMVIRKFLLWMSVVRLILVLCILFSLWFFDSTFIQEIAIIALLHIGEILKILTQSQQFEEDTEEEERNEEPTEEPTENGDLNRAHAETVLSEKKKVRLLPQDEIDRINAVWEDTKITSIFYEFISGFNDTVALNHVSDIILDEPQIAHVRSKDGRGPMWWAHEKDQPSVVAFLKKLGVNEELKGANGETPLDLSSIVADCLEVFVHA